MTSRKVQTCRRQAFPLAAFLLLLLAGAEIFNVAWGSGHFLFHLSFKWVVVLLGFTLGGTSILIVLDPARFSQAQIYRVHSRWVEFQYPLGGLKWLAVFFMSAIPAYFVFYSPWSTLFLGFFTRLLLFALALLGTTFLLSKKGELFSRNAFLLAGLVIGSLLVLAESFVLVSNYPFALHWSEGNRLWDYSLAFGRARYNYPTGKSVFAWIDPVRQVLWGLPFLLSGLPIWAARAWNAALTTIPYALLGWAAFKPLKKARGQWILAGLWAMIFLNQGPLYTPLVLSAILVALVRRAPVWLALPLVMIAGYFAGISRFTWIFAPGIWAVLITLGDAALQSRKLNPEDWLRAGTLGLAGIWIKGLPLLLGIASSVLFAGPPQIVSGLPGEQSVESLQGLQATATGQPFIWYRLFPNDIYPPGILLGLSLASLPLVLLLIFSIRRGLWKTERWQRGAALLGLGAFLIVGVIASAKIGGGTDLHNMDMFLITLVFLAGLAWEGGLYKQIAKLASAPAYLLALLAATIFVPAFAPMVEGKILELPTQERTQFVLGRIQEKVACARQYGEVLFMDQRQLITFGQMGGLPLVVDYEKKYVMDQALAGNAVYFEQFRTDLAAGRFSLIVSEREAEVFKEPDEETIGDGLVEENNAWVKWVTLPLFEYYESVGNYRDVAVELFMPLERSFDCP